MSFLERQVMPHDEKEGQKEVVATASVEPIHVISLGAGVQSSTMALMAARGLISPMPVAAIFADTQAEPGSVYRWLDYLERHLPFPIWRATKGSLEAFMSRNGHKDGLMRRHCTGDFKIDVIHRELRRRFGRKRSLCVIMWIGISIDEAHRMKPSRKSWITNIWPLIDRNISRRACLQWMQASGYPEPPRSSCVFCPFHSDAEWLRLKTAEPREFARAVLWEQQYQAALGRTTEIDGKPFLHRTCKPLHLVEFNPNDKQPDLFGNECEGMCGV